MKDKLRNYIQAHRTDFDAATPDSWVWLNLEKIARRLRGADKLEKYLLRHRFLLDVEEPPAGVWEAVEKQVAVPDQPGASLETFIRQNREAFDSALPDPGIWTGIESANRPASPRLKVHWHRHLLRAAAAILLLLVGVGLGICYSHRVDLPASSDGMALGEVSPEYAELEAYYKRDIAVKREKLATFTANRSSDVEADLQQLDQVMGELRQDLAGVPPGNREQVVRAMIENYKAKAAILQRVLEYLEAAPVSPDTPIHNSTEHETESI